jgi:hypothetical protein
MEISYDNNKEKLSRSEYHKKRIQTRDIIIREREGINRKSRKVGLHFMRSTLNCKMERAMRVENSGQCAYRLQNHMVSHQMM